jgi:hypothetical protein
MFRLPEKRLLKSRPPLGKWGLPLAEMLFSVSIPLQARLQALNSTIYAIASRPIGSKCNWLDFRSTSMRTWAP